MLLGHPDALFQQNAVDATQTIRENGKAFFQTKGFQVNKARWIERALPGMNITLAPVAGDAGMHSVVFKAGNTEMSIRRTEPSSLEVRTAERSYSALLPPDSEGCLMREELSILGRDPAFERVLA